MIGIKSSRSSKLTQKEMKQRPEVERKKFALQYIEKAKALSSEKALLAHRYLTIALQLDPSNYLPFYEKALLYLRFGKNQKKPYAKALNLLKQSKDLIPPNQYEVWITWGATLHKLGKQTGSVFHLQEAEKKFLQVLQNKSPIPKVVLSQLYWKRGSNFIELAAHSGEALDYQSAIRCFQEALLFETAFPSEFWKEYGYAHMQLALLINQNEHYHISSGLLHKALTCTDKDYEIWGLLGEVFTQLYINTLHEPYFERANHFYAKAVRQKTLREDLWLDWAALLAESGKINQDKKKLRLSVEKCVRASHFSNSPSLTAQWVESLSYLGKVTGRMDLLLEAENKILKVIHKYSDEPDLWYAYAVCMSSFAYYYQDPGFYDLAIEKAQKGLALDRTHAELWHLMGVLHTQIGLELEDPEILALSKKFFLKACDLKPASPEIYYDFAFALLKYADLAEDKSDLDTSLFYFEKLFTHQKEALLDHPEWLFYYAYALDLKGNEQEEESYLIQAVEVYWQVMLIEPDFPSLYFQLALTFSHLGEITSEKVFYQKAFHYYALASQKEEDNDQLWLEWGLSLTHYALLSYEEKESELLLQAETHIAHAGILGNPYAYYHLACLYSLMGQIEASMRFFEKAWKMKVLPPIEEILQDEWLEAIKETEIFSSFLHKLEQKEKKLG